MPISNKERIRYGSLTLGLATDYHILADTLTITEDYESFIVEAQILVQNDTAATFETLCESLESGIRTKYQRLRVDIDGNIICDFNPADASGLLIVGTAEIISEDEWSTANSRAYRVSWTGQREADQASRNGRRNSSVSAFFDESGRKTLTLNGEYTATAATGSADASFELAAAFDAWATLVQTAYGGTYERLTLVKNIDQDETEAAGADPGGSILSFTAVYQEILLDQNSSQTDDPDIVNPTIQVRRQRTGPLNSDVPGPRGQRGVPLQRLEVDYNASMATTLNTDSDWSQKWQGTIRPWILTHMKSITGASTLAIIEDNFEPDRTNSKLMGSLKCLAIFEGTLIASALTVSDDGVDPVSLSPVWNGNAYAKVKFTGPASLRRTVTLSRTEAANDILPALPESPRNIISSLRDPQGDGMWVRVSHRREIPEVGRIGITGATIDTIRMTETAVYEWTSEEDAEGATTDTVTLGFGGQVGTVGGIPSSG